MTCLQLCTRYIARTAVLTAMASVSTVVLAQPAGWREKDAGGCKTFVPPEFSPEVTMAWKGSCSNGRLKGEGILYVDMRDGSRLVMKASFSNGVRQGTYVVYEQPSSGPIIRTDGAVGSKPVKTQARITGLPDW